MIEQNIIEWIEINDSVQKIEIYNNKKYATFFIINYLLSEYSNFSELFYILMIFLFYFQILELNIVKLDTTEDGFLKVIQYFENVFLFHKVIINNNYIYLLLFIIICFIYLFSIIISIVNVILYKKKKKTNRILLTINSLINIISIYYINGPAIHIFLYKLLCKDGTKTFLCPIKGIFNIFLFILNLIYIVYIILSSFITSLFINDIGSVNISNVKCKINNNYTTIIVISKILYFIFYYFIEQFVDENITTINIIILLIYISFFLLINIFISIYSSRQLFYYNHNINNAFHYCSHYSTWFSFCIFLKNVLKIKDISLFIILGLFIITIGLYYNNNYSNFKLITEFNFFEENNLNNIEKYNQILLDIIIKNEARNKILISGVIKKFEEYLYNNPELYDQYKKIKNSQYLRHKFPSHKEQIILSIIYIIYSYNIEKSKDNVDLTLCMCYFLINKLKNPTYAIWLCTKLKSYSFKQSYYIFVLMEDIKKYLSKRIKKNKMKLKIKNLEVSKVILYYQFVSLFKIKIYDSICTLVEYYDILRNKIATTKTLDNYLRVGEDALVIRKEVFILWEKIIILNPFCLESLSDFLLYVDTILQDNIMAKNEEKRFYELQAEKLHEKHNIYYSMFNQDNCSILLADGNNFNGKIIYKTPNFPFLFMFNEKEIINLSLEDLLPNCIQNFHKYIVDDLIKNSNIDCLYKDKRNSILKGKSGILFNVNLYVKTVPNLCYGLIYFILVEKINEENFMFVLDNDLLINGFTETAEVTKNYILGNNYGLSHFINGHHIGLIIPEILFYLNYDNISNSFYLEKNNIDLKGYLYPITNFKELDEKIPIILEELKNRNIYNEKNNNKIEIFQEYNDLILLLKKQNLKPFSIFFRIESYKFIGGKYMYYRIYITNDLMTEKKPTLYKNANIKSLSNEDEKEYVDRNNLSKIKSKISSEPINENLNKKDISQFNSGISSKSIIKFKEIKKIKLKVETTVIKNKPEILNNNKNDKNVSKKLVKKNEKKKKDSKNNKQENKNPSKSNEEPVVFNKVKSHILLKHDCVHVKLMRHLSYYFIILNIILIIVDFFYAKYKTKKIFIFLKQNIYFPHLKMCIGCIYISSINLKFFNLGYIANDICPNNDCKSFFLNIFKNCLVEMNSEESNIHYYYSVLKKSASEKFEIKLYSYNTEETNNLNLDINNILYLITSHSMKIIAQLKDNSLDNKKFYEIYMRNLISNSLTYFKSNSDGFIGNQKNEESYKISFHFPICIAIYVLYLIYTMYIYYDYIILIKDIHIFYFDKLMNFVSEQFELYLKKINDIKNQFGNNNDNDDKNSGELDFGDEKEEKNEVYSLKKNDKTKKDEKKNEKDLKSKENKIMQQRLKNKNIISNYLCNLGIFYLVIFLIIFLLSLSYYLTIILISRKLKNDYLKFDSQIETINKLYLDSLNIFILFKEQIEKFERTGNKSNLEIPKDSEIARPKFDNSLMNLIKSSKYTQENLQLFIKLYNNNGCEILVKNEAEKQICENLLSSMLTKGLEQTIVQINNIIITNVLDELNSLKTYKTIYDIYKPHSTFSDYEIFINYYLINSFLKTQNMFDVFRENEQNYINKIYNITIIIFFLFYLLLSIFLIVYIYSYKAYTGYFLSFIGIIPPKFLADDNEFYSQVTGLEPFY